MSQIVTLLRQAAADGSYGRIMLNPRAQFGTEARPYLGPLYLPERPVPKNEFREDAIKFRSVIANAGDRYSPAQKKGGDLIAGFLVELGNSDISRDMNGQDYDALTRILESTASMDAMEVLLQWVDKLINVPLLEFNEKTRWDAIVDSQVIATGDNGYKFQVDYANPAGHRVAAGGTWSSDAYDPYDDILAIADLFASKGEKINAIVAPRTVVAKMSGNDKVKARTGVATISASGQIQATAGRASIDAINNSLDKDGLPPITTYDRQYRTQTGTGYFLKRDVMVFLSTTGRDATVDLGDSEKLLSDTLGYLAVGVPVGQSTPGRTIFSEHKMDKPPRIINEGWQTSLPVIQEPEGIAVITGIA